MIGRHLVQRLSANMAINDGGDLDKGQTSLTETIQDSHGTCHFFWMNFNEQCGHVTFGTQLESKILCTKYVAANISE